ncbi:hypothetical protein BJ928_105118 [Rhizobium sp. WW_1]|jgi:hypothetical protein|nr:hypothetical protein BJ928_105118 [Rhizobium sp. WW_1]
MNKFLGLILTCLALSACEQRGTEAVDCPSQSPNQIAQGPDGPYEFREDCAPSALTCIDPDKKARTGNGTVICRARKQ